MLRRLQRARAAACLGFGRVKRAGRMLLQKDAAQLSGAAQAAPLLPTLRRRRGLVVAPRSGERQAAPRLLALRRAELHRPRREQALRQPRGRLEALQVLETPLQRAQARPGTLPERRAWRQLRRRQAAARRRPPAGMLASPTSALAPPWRH